MEFEWDESKDRANNAKHGIGFERAQTVFDDFCLIREDRRHDYGERRWQVLGRLGESVVILVAFTHRDDRLRIISARPANERERIIYYEALQKRTDQRGAGRA